MRRSRLVLLLTLSAAGAVASVRGQGASEPAEAALQAIREGRWEAAEAALGLAEANGEFPAPAPPTAPLRLRLTLELLDRRGRYEEAANVARFLYEAAVANPADPRLLQEGAVAAAYLQNWEDANEMFRRAAEAGEPSLSLLVDWGNLYVEKYNPAEAEQLFQEALAAESREGERWTAVDAWLGMVRARLTGGGGGVDEALEEAEKLDPDYPGLQAVRGYLRLREARWEEAATAAEATLDSLPGDLDQLRIRCGARYFLDDRRAYDSCLADLARVNPRDGRFFELLGDLSVTQRRLEEAVAFYTRALEARPNLWSALASRGINLLRLGREEEGVADLERAYDHDPYNIWLVNTLRLVDSFENFEVIETERFRVRLHKKESAMLKPYVLPLLERSLAELERRYDHRVPFRVTFEMYPDHEDFAVRTLGLPGLGALGATVGRIVAMDSPAAREKGTFHWASTLWHEMAHVVALDLSRNRVPRWFTEGLSMIEELRGGPGWGDPLPLAVIRAYQEKRLPSLEDLEAAFLRPKRPDDVIIAYHTAAAAVEFLEKTYGSERLRAMLVAYGDGLHDDQVFEEVLGTSRGELANAFQAFLDTKFGALARHLARVEPPGHDEASLREALADHPDNFVLLVALGDALLREGRHEEAAECFERAVQLVPGAVEPGGAYTLWLQAVRRMGDRRAEERILAAWWARYPVPPENALRLAELREAGGEKAGAAEVLEQALWAAPLDPEIHRRLGALYLEAENFTAARREFEVLLAAGPTDEARVRYWLAKALLGLGDRNGARRQVLLALEIAPSFEEAQRLLLEVAAP
ncbi:MAG: hypothetical protein Kow00109_12730 [Acidobacteriota bacterium]